jgi:hypothetical protein
MKLFVWTLIAIVALSSAAAAQELPDSPQPAPSVPPGCARVQGLARGEEIMVTLHGWSGIPCLFAGATDTTLFCESPYDDREYRYDRVEIERVRRNDERRNRQIVVGSLVAAGFIWGVAAPNTTGVPRVLDGLLVAGIAGLLGRVVSLPAELLIPGRLVYRQSHADRNARASAPPPQPATADPNSTSNVP